MSVQDEINIIQYLLEKNIEQDDSYSEYKYLLSLEQYLMQKESE